MRTVAVVLLLALAGAAAARQLRSDEEYQYQYKGGYQGYGEPHYDIYQAEEDEPPSGGEPSHKHKSHVHTPKFTEPCDPEVSDCDAVNPPHPKHNVTKVTIETPPTTAEEPRGPVVHPTRPVFDPVPRPVPEEPKKEHNKVKEDPIIDDTSKPEVGPGVLLPVFRPVPRPVAPEPKPTHNKIKEDPIIDDTSKPTGPARLIPLPVFRPNPRPVEEEKPKNKVIVKEGPIIDSSINPKSVHDEDPTPEFDWHQYEHDAKHEAKQIAHEHRHDKYSSSSYESYDEEDKEYGYETKGYEGPYGSDKETYHAYEHEPKQYNNYNDKYLAHMYEQATRY